MSMYVLFNRNTLTPIQFSYDSELLYSVKELLEAHFHGGYEVGNVVYYTDLLYKQNETEGLLEGL